MNPRREPVDSIRSPSPKFGPISCPFGSNLFRILGRGAGGEGQIPLVKSVFDSWVLITLKAANSENLNMDGIARDRLFCLAGTPREFGL